MESQGAPVVSGPPAGIAPTLTIHSSLRGKLFSPDALEQVARSKKKIAVHFTLNAGSVVQIAREFPPPARLYVALQYQMLKAAGYYLEPHLIPMAIIV